MRWMSKRSFGTILVLSILALFLTAACTGPEGSQGSSGSSGSAGPTGAAGPAGATGPTGPAGSTGPAGATGATGAAGSAGPEGPTTPAAIVVVPKGLAGAAQPATVSSDKVEFTVYGSGFKPDQPILVELKTAALKGFMTITGGDLLVTRAGTFMVDVMPGVGTAVGVGVHSLRVSAGDLEASTPVVVAAK